MYPPFRRSPWRIAVVISVVFVSIGIAFYFWSTLHDGKERIAVHEPVTICYTWTLGALIGVAQGQGFFADEGLAATVKPYLVGRNAFDSMLAGACDLASVAETPIVFKSFERQDFRILVTTRTDEDYNQIIARRDRGVTSPHDLKGKRIGVLRATSAHFFLYRFLLEQGLRTADVRLVFAGNAPKLQAALLSGKVDAVALWQPHTAQMQQVLGERAVVFTVPGLALTTTNITASEKLVQDRPQVVTRLLRALERALAFARTDPRMAMATVARVVDVSEGDVAESWPKHQELSLTQAFLLSLEDEAYWAHESGLVGQAKVPNYLRLLYLEGLESVAPQAVTVLH